MSAKMEIVGNLGEPKLSFTQSGKQVLNLSVAHTPRRKNQQGQWEDVLGEDGKPQTLWVRAAFWEDEAALIVSQVSQGMRVRLEGEPSLSVREHDGKTYTNLELKFPSIMFLPRRPQQGAQGGHSASSGASAGASSSGDGWAAPGAAQGFSSEAPS